MPTSNALAETLFIKHYEKSQQYSITKRNDNFPATEPEDMEYCDLTKSPIAVTKKFSELQENSVTQYNDFREKNYEQRSNLPKTLKF